MKNIGYRILIGGCILISLLLVASTLSCADGVTDEQNDVYHWTASETGYGTWQPSVDSKPSIDIIKLDYSYSDSTLTLTMQVAGEIAESENVMYWGYLNTTGVNYLFYYANGEGYGIGLRTDQSGMITGIVEHVGDKINAVFTGVDKEPSNVTLWGWAAEYTNKSDIYQSEWWGDWAPNTEAPWYTVENGEGETNGEGAPEENGNEGGVPDQGNGGDEGETGTTQTSKKTPGFEILIVLVAILIALVLIGRGSIKK